MSRWVITLLTVALATPFDECLQRIRREDEATPATPVDAGAAASATATAAATVVANPTVDPPPRKRTSPTPPAPPGPTPKPGPSPTPTVPPGPTPTVPPGPTPPAPGRHLEFATGPGKNGGLYPHAADFIAVAKANAPMLKKCFDKAGPLTDAWSVKATVVVPKGGAVSLQIAVTHEGSPETGTPIAQSLEQCHRATMGTWSWPPTTGIEGSSGGPGYIVVLSNLYWVADR